MSKNDQVKPCPNCQSENSIHRLRCQKCHQWLIRHHWGHERRWWMAAFLSILIPGLGHVYNGRLTRGILLFSIWTVWSGLIMFLTLTLMDQPSQDSHIILFYGIFLISIVIHFVILSSAIKLSLKNKNYHPKRFNRWYVYFLVIFFVFPVGVRFWHWRKANVFHFYKIPSTSMMNTLVPGDVVVSNQRYYLKNKPDRGNLVIFQFPDNWKVTFIKRIIGMPGDTLLIRSGTVIVNNRTLSEPYIVSDTEGNGHEKKSSVFGPVVIPNNSYFVMGDNRAWSIDSRRFGPIHKSYIIGKPQWICWSWNMNIPVWKIFEKWKSIKYSRFGKTIL